METAKDNIYIITGGSGFGKTELINHLHQLGYLTSNEVARELISEEMIKGGTILPWFDIRAFQQEVLKRRLAFYHSVEKGQIAFVDRAIPDQIAFARYRGFKDPSVLVEHTNTCRYNKCVFATPPWADIYTTDKIRTETYEEACVLHQIIIEVYEEFDYKIIDLPYTSVTERAEFIINQITQKL